MAKANRLSLLILFFLLLSNHIYSLANIAYVANYTNNSVSIYTDDEDNNFNKWKEVFVSSPFAIAVSPNKKQLYILQTGITGSIKELSTSWTLNSSGLIDPEHPLIQAFTTEPFSHQMVFIPNVSRSSTYSYYAYIVSKSGVSIHGLDSNDIISPQKLGLVYNVTSPTSMDIFTSNILGSNTTYAYITDLDHNRIKMYNTINGGKNLTPLETPSIPTGSAPVKIIVNHDFGYVYVVCYAEKAVYEYRINKFDGELIYDSKIETFGLNPTDIQIDFYNDKAFVAANNIILVYSIKQNGQLVYDELASKQVGPTSKRATITGIALADVASYLYRGKLYVIADQIDEIHRFELNRSYDKPFNLINRRILNTGYNPTSIAVLQK